MPHWKLVSSLVLFHSIPLTQCSGSYLMRGCVNVATELILRLKEHIHLHDVCYLLFSLFAGAYQSSRRSFRSALCVAGMLTRGHRQANLDQMNFFIVLRTVRGNSGWLQFFGTLTAQEEPWTRTGWRKEQLLILLLKKWNKSQDKTDVHDYLRLCPCASVCFWNCYNNYLY